MTKTVRLFSLSLVLCLSAPLFAAECETALVDGTRYHLGDIAALVATDVDSDGRPDLLAANSTESEIKVLHNDGTRFSWRAPIALSHPVLRLYGADIDGNGRQDIVATGRLGISTLLANGDGTYDVVASPANNLHAVSVLGEFTSDGKLDLAALGNDRLLRVYAGATDGTFTLVSTSAQPIGKQRSPGSMATGELTHDTNKDLVITGDFGAAIYAGDGHGVFTAGLSLNTATVGQRVAVADFDHDTIDDILLRIQTDSGVLHLGKDAYAPGPRKFLTCPGAAATVDLDGDGKLDGVSDTFAVCKGNGDGTFTEAWTGAMYFLEQVTSSKSVSVADFNGDGRLDIAGATPKGDIGIFYAKTGLQFTGSRDYELLPSSKHVDTADLNGDGRDDIITGGYYGFGVFLADANGNLTPATGYSGDGAFVIAEVSGDTKPDIFVAGKVLTGNGDGTLLPGEPSGSSTQYGQLAAVDLNGDGKMDFVGSSPENDDPHGLTVMLRSESGYTKTFYPTGHGWIRGVAASDVTGDSIPDVFAIGHEEDGGPFALESRTLRMLPGRVDGSLGPVVTVAQGVVSADVLIERIDGDAHNDLIFAAHTESDDAILILRGAGNGTFTEHQRIVLPADTEDGTSDIVRLAMGDFDGNGLRDIVAVISTAQIAWVLLQNSNHFFEPAWSFIHTILPGAAAVGDFNGDGADDLAIITSPSSMDVHLSACRTALAVLPPRVRLSGPSQSVSERPITFFATVDAPGAGGEVAFYSDEGSFNDYRTLLGTAPVVNGVAALKLPLRGSDNVKIHATYSGDGRHATSRSNAITHVFTAPTGLPRRRAVRR